MTYFVAKIPSLYYKGDAEILPTSFVEESGASEHARSRTVAPVNVSTRIDNKLYIACNYVVIGAESDAEALRIAKTDARFVEMRKTSATTYIED